MKLPILMVVALAQTSGGPVAPQSVRVAYANQLYLDTLSQIIQNHEDADELEVVAKGAYGQVLYIRDDANSAKAFYMHMTGDKDTRASLLKLGFKMVVLVNAKHGTFVVDLMTNDAYKAEERNG